MISAFKKIFSLPDLRKKILITFLLLTCCRIATFIPVPGINKEMILNVFKYTTGGGQNLFQLMDMFSGGAFSQMTIIALGVMPYISASIIMQLSVAIFPALQRELKENMIAGRKKINRYTKVITMIMAIFQATIYSKVALSLNASHNGIIIPHLLDLQMFGMPILFYLAVVFTMVTGSLSLIWIGEQITEKGVGNGISLIITLGILSSLPSTIGSIIKQLNLESQEPGQLNFLYLAILAIAFVFIILGTILVILGERRIPLQYARQSNNMESSYLPLKINYAGVIPVIFASSFMMFPSIIMQFVGKNSFLGSFSNYFSPGSFVYMALTVLLIMFFTYFWTATQFKPDQIASDMKKSSAFIPGIRQGKPTQHYIEHTMSRLTFIGGVVLCVIAILPSLVNKILSVDYKICYFFGGTSLLILVGVVLDTSKQISSYLIMKRYKGFIKIKK